MNFHTLQEAIEENVVLRILSEFIQAVQSLYDTISVENIDDDFIRQVSYAAVTMQYHRNKLNRLRVPDSIWASMRTNDNKSWDEFKSVVVSGMLPRLIASLKDLAKNPASKDNTKLQIAREKVNSLQDYITGLAPNTITSSGNDAIEDIAQGSEA